uniref:Elongator complex protein 4 n=1 Tax=Timema genevievae TaxID=629358 RepID=A0A7R9PPB0_TIMGE|nr:unnamed protein product [Timema genevievae]
MLDWPAEDGEIGVRTLVKSTEGGGLAVGTITLIEEDTFGIYAKLLLKYFLSEGVMCRHSLLVASQDSDPKKMVKLYIRLSFCIFNVSIMAPLFRKVSELPAPVQSESSSERSGANTQEDKMMIAWRYQNMRTVQSSPTGSHFGHYFDLTKNMPQDVLDQIDISYWSSGRQTDAAGKYSCHTDTAGKYSCQTDAAGKYSCHTDTAGKYSCQTDAAGKYSCHTDKAGKYSCQTDAAGKYSCQTDAAGKYSCHTDTAGKYSCQTDTAGFCNPAYRDLLTTIQLKISLGQFQVSDTPEKRNILRVAIHSLGSPLWCADQQRSDLTLFLYCLRSLMRSSLAVCAVTVPSHIFQARYSFVFTGGLTAHLLSRGSQFTGILRFQDPCTIKRCEHLCDVSVRLESFAGSDRETNPVLKDYHGFFHINKLSAINTLASHVPESLDLAFKLRRKKFLIEKLHLPPELQESTQREQDDILTTPSSGSCGGGGRRNLDF